MPQIFRKRADSIFRITILSLVLLVFGLIGFLYVIDYSPYNTAVGYPVAQPVPYSHAHHVGGLGIDCRYCHRSVEQSPYAGIPAVEVCMNCHQQIWDQAPVLEPIRQAFENKRTITWQRVYDLPDFTYFNHSVHVLNGVGCETCHGRVDQMPLLIKTTNLKMEWCLECHRNPTPFLRPLEHVTTMGWQPSKKGEFHSTLQNLTRKYDTKNLTDCDTCHR